MDSTAPVSLSASKASPPSLLIRAPLTSFDDDSSDISPLSSEEDVGYESAVSSEADNELVGIVSGYVGGALVRSLSMPVAKLTRDEDFEDEEVGEDEDEFFGVAKVPVDDLNRSDGDEVVGDEVEIAEDEFAAEKELQGGNAEGENVENLVGETAVEIAENEFDIAEVKVEKAVEGGSSLSKEEGRDREGVMSESSSSMPEENFLDGMSMTGEKNASEDNVAAYERGFSLDTAIGIVERGIEHGGHTARDDDDGKLTGEGISDSMDSVSNSDIIDGLLDKLDVSDIVIGEALLGTSDNSEILDVSAGEPDAFVDSVALDVSSTYHEADEVSPGMVEMDSKVDSSDTKEEKGSLASNESAIVEILKSSDSTKHIAKDSDESSFNTNCYSQLVDGQIALDSDEEIDSDDEDERKRALEDAIAALLKEASSSGADGIINSSEDANATLSIDQPAGSLKTAPTHPFQSNLFNSSELYFADVPDNDMTDEEKKIHEKVELLRIKFLRLVHRLGHSPEDPVVAQVLYRLNLAEGICHGRVANRSFSLENAKMKALQLEADGQGLDFSCNILVLGKSGVGKSATINSILGGDKSQTNAFKPATMSAKVITGTTDGIKIHVIDTPGLGMSGTDQASNRLILSSLKKYLKKFPPDIMLYVDRLDVQTRDISDFPLLRSITNILGSSIWFNAIVALTHAASAPPDGPNGSPLSFDMFVAQRSHVIQQSIRLAAGDMRLISPVALVENHTACTRNREGHRILPNGINWSSKLMLLCYSSKVLYEANSLLKFNNPAPGKMLGFHFRSPPLPFLLSSLLQSRAYPKLPTDQSGENLDSDLDLDDLSDVDQDEDEYDQLPPFGPLNKLQLASLTNAQRKAYFDEYDYRVMLLQKKQWKEEIKRLKEKKKKGESVQDQFISGDFSDEIDQSNSPSTLQVPLPDMVLPPSFDSDSPTYRYRFLEPTSQFVARPVMDTHGWDHDCSYDAVSLEENLALGGQFPAVISAQVNKDKKEFSIHLDSSISVKYSENASSLAGFDIQAVGKQLAYILRGETKFKNLKKNKTTGGMSLIFLGETIATGLKIEDQLSIGRRGTIVGSTGAIRAKTDTVYGANLEVRLRDKDCPIGQALTTLGLSLMRWHGDLALGANLQSQFSVGRSKLAVRVGLNNKLTGQISMKINTSEQLQVALVSIIPIVASLLKSLTGESGHYA